jgi:diaminohydroxyphosphoribosylaminopyrimidine deaminase/5-amino-6-(5-phosphoribosylamino)uracil reductase
MARLQATGAQLLPLPPGTVLGAAVGSQASAHPDLHALMALLAERGVNELHVEAGARLTGSLIDSGLADEWLVYLAPKLLGDGRGLADILPVHDLQSPPTWAWREATLTGDNVRLLARRIGADAF